MNGRRKNVHSHPQYRPSSIKRSESINWVYYLPYCVYHIDLRLQYRSSRNRNYYYEALHNYPGHNTCSHQRCPRCSPWTYNGTGANTTRLHPNLARRDGTLRLGRLSYGTSENCVYTVLVSCDLTKKVPEEPSLKRRSLKEARTSTVSNSSLPSPCVELSKCPAHPRCDDSVSSFRGEI
ncbi:hypothetical protein BDN72DRAFT_568026 [Pluteus cervinus]|uniref:Uncharacterized protein n=1 Tax=Pluteus cervinus TaxID=181527 RepID=A0ACD3AWW1_9AGAR|nr:hypothetical protein BDN72DRAFT_568026 [Pluteus cervinus]